MARGQPGPKAADELERAVLNYKIIIEEANRLDPSYECSRTQDTLYAIFKCCVPFLTEEVELLVIPESRKESLKTSIRDLDKLKLAKDTKDIKLDDNESHESPIIHLMYLAVEKQAISYSREHSSEGENWGRLAAFSGYLKERAFKDWKDENGTTYWPGLPTCIMVYVPIWTLQTNYHISFSAALDRFVYASATRKNL